MATSNLKIKIRSQGCDAARAVLERVAELVSEIETGDGSHAFEFDTNPAYDGSIALKVRPGATLSALRDALNRLD